mmetsp:Transcript_8200/g.19616  ORF Transcript_8200/g.19616 Transcript_8200/m.19616 type:complete len:186 (+) Transcript_8200:61-618(+)
MAGATQKYEEYARQEIAFLENELKNWFMQRKIAMERNIAIRKTLQVNNFSGLESYAEGIPDAQKVMWTQLVNGKPTLENSLGVDAREMKADMYLKMFKQSTDLDHPCRIPGSAFLRCLKQNFAGNDADRDSACGRAFGVFDACRKGIQQQQAEATDAALAKQDIADRRAKSLFERRSVLLDTLSQ